MTVSKKKRVRFNQDKIEKFRLRKDSLRIATSDVAAITGFNPYASIPQIILSLLYQGSIGQKLLQQDASVLGLKFVDENSVLEELACQAGKQTVSFLHEALLSKPDTVQKAKQIKERVLKEAKESDKLTKKELKFIEEKVRQNVDTNFGTFHEKDALDAYEKKVGWEVRDRNSEIREWKFMESDDCNIPGGIKPIGPATQQSFFCDKHLDGTCEYQEHTKKRQKSRKNRNDSDIIDHSTNLTPVNPIQVIDIDESSVDSKNPKNILIKENKTQEALVNTDKKSNLDNIFNNSCKKEEVKPFFSILGCIDGIRDELWCDPESDTSKTENEIEQYDEFSNPSEGKWELRQIVIECKHRMNKAFHPPPLYDQIQAVIYCLMYNLDQADIVQVLRKNKSKSIHDKKNNSKISDQIVYAKYDSTVKEGKSCDKDKQIHAKTNLDQETENITQQHSKNSSLSKSNQSDLDITISRISLNDPVFQHMHNFHHVILPRLRSMVDLVYDIRSDDCKRYRFLLAASGIAINEYDITSKRVTSNLNNDVMDDAEAWKILFEECSWLIDCDTLFSREH